MSSLHYVRYGNHPEQRFVSGKLRDTYEGLVYHANLVAGSAGGIAKFVMREALHERPFVVNPITHEFQRPQGEALQVKAWVRKLADDYYGGPFADAVSRGEPIAPEAFGGDVRGIVDRVLDFQRNTLNAQAVATEEARYLRFTQPQFALRPVALICPYLAFLHSEEQCLSVNLRLLETGLTADPRVAAKLAFPRSLLTSGRLPGILDGYNELAPSRYYLWIGDFSELEVRTEELQAFASLLDGLGSRVTNLYGGFLSMLLSHEDIALLDGVCNGPQYGEDRGLIPTTGFGSPAARFYVRDLHRRVRYRDALRLFERLGWLASEAAYFANVCSCPTCRQLVNEHGPARGFAQFGQTKPDKRGVPRTTGRSLVHASNHYMYAKRWERNSILNEGVDTLTAGIQEAIERYRQVGQSLTAHLHRWRDLLHELRRV
ncbi:MAG: hypothetical protein OXN92_05835 [Gammaproteobacteria bacterium]|nr:hypothetical protein [Gammaproteobacteria bacterium]